MIKYCMTEKLDIRNVIEVDKIRRLLFSEPDLLSMFEIVCIMCNDRLNQKEKEIQSLPLEHNIEPELSDHESDEEDDDIKNLTLTMLLNSSN